MNAALDTASAWTDTAFVARHIAARAGVSSQTFYKHYSGAQQLLDAAFDRELAWLTNPEQARAGTPTQADHPISRDPTDVLYVVENIWHAADTRARYATAHRLLDALVDDLVPEHDHANHVG